MSAEDPPKHYEHHLQVSQFYNLNQVCRTLVDAFGWHIYQVGSSLTRPTWRDVDVRCLLSDPRFDQMFPGAELRDGYHSHPMLALMNVAISEWMSARTGLPIDFQIQRQTQANEKHDGQRNALGVFLQTGVPA